MKTETTAIFDVGKTNKKLFLFDVNYQIVYEKNDTLPETTDEDGDACEDIELLSRWVVESFQEVQQNTNFNIRAVNFSGYGASFVHLGADLKPVTPLYNYLKPFSETLKKQFYDTYGGQEAFAVATASPVLGNLNAGMQLYRLKYEKPVVFEQIKYSLHLPQYLSFLISGQCLSDITSIGCHTNLWNFQKNQYHEWVKKEGIETKLAPLRITNYELGLNPKSKTVNRKLKIGSGLHDSSAALIPYLATIEDEFILISTGTWCISLNPFNGSPLTFSELQQDSLCYLTCQGHPVKAARLFLGYQHEEQTKRMYEHFGVSQYYFKTVQFDESLLNIWNEDLNHYSNYESAYHALIQDFVNQQVISVNLIFEENKTKKIFVDGGFSKNEIYMKLLAKSYPTVEVYAAAVAQASALGAAIAVNGNTLPDNLIGLKRYY
jgi:sugar (pentulose or hexulose) kinase